MIDLHCHLLPGVDDGARTLDDSLAMAQQAVAEGISHILVTPHHKNGKYLNPKEAVMEATAALQAELDSRGIGLTLFPGQELRINGEILEDIEKGDILFIDDESQYLLIEFPTMSIPHFTESLFFKLRQKGITPVIVHPERNQAIIDDPNILLPFIERGALAQVTASSYVGAFGKDNARLSNQLIEANLVHILASDAHNTRGRGFHFRKAVAKLEAEFGPEKVAYFKQNAKDLFNGDVVHTEDPSEVYQKKKRFRLFGK
ncbi:CpsB/CapC family capsule biosynthesis tyrosine phosphatase [Trichococcus shcherbakoviae]|uniref:tyrosine-protein phosphatase n=1 Tax=Trichococcus shcherbakoviae TaxID=2094020 RepID=UPI0029F54B31|nr:CpsB/CapC family capsule biosynthesis tyrosine phosphatase [Trichococcus shcherbakoviae]